MGFLDFPRNVFNAAIDVPVHFVTHFTDDLVERTRARPHPPRNFPERYYGTHAPGEIPHPSPSLTSTLPRRHRLAPGDHLGRLSRLPLLRVPRHEVHAVPGVHVHPRATFLNRVAGNPRNVR